MSYFALPRGIYRIGIALMFERIAFYGVRSLLVYFLIQEISFSKDDAIDLTNHFKDLASLSLILGGIAVDFLILRWRPMVLGGLAMLFGALSLSLAGFISNSALVYIALGALVMGQAVFRPAMYSQLVTLFGTENDKEYPLSFMILYLFINMGAFLAPITCATVANMTTWSAGFLVAAAAAASVVVLIKDFEYEKQTNQASSLFKRMDITLIILGIAIMGFGAIYLEKAVGQWETVVVRDSLRDLVAFLASMIAYIVLPFLWIIIRKKFPTISSKTFVLWFFLASLITSAALYLLNSNFEGPENGFIKFGLAIIATMFLTLTDLLAFSVILKNAPAKLRATFAGGYLMVGHLLPR